MRYLALALDYDGTLATDGRIEPATLTALAQARAAGRRLVMVTGRELDDLRAVCPTLHLFERVVVENGALMYRPDTQREVQLAPAPPPALAAALRARGVQPLSLGRVIIATLRTQAAAVQAALRDLGLELSLVFNNEALMLLPPGCDKGTGLRTALADLAIPARGVVGLGDGENDLALFEACGLGVAVANAVPALKARAHVVTRGARGRGVVETVRALLADDLPDARPG